MTDAGYQATNDGDSPSVMTINIIICRRRRSLNTQTPGNTSLRANIGKHADRKMFFRQKGNSSQRMASVAFGIRVQD